MLHNRGCSRRAVQTIGSHAPATRPGVRDTALVLVAEPEGGFRLHHAIRVQEQEHPQMVENAMKRRRWLPVTGTLDEEYISVGVAAKLPYPPRLDIDQRINDAEAAGLLQEPDDHTIAFYGGDRDHARAEVRLQARTRLNNDRSDDAYDWDAIAPEWGRILDSIERRKLTPRERVWDTEVELAHALHRVDGLRDSLSHLKERARKTEQVD